jgi:hypothetical protein
MKKVHIEFGYLDSEEKSSARVTVEKDGKKAFLSFSAPFKYETTETLQAFVKKIERAINGCNKVLDSK